MCRFPSFPGDRLEVTLQFDGPPPGRALNLQCYTIERPYRIAGQT